ncbi:MULTISPECIES: hypothetical protein [unclassified Bradyrhizobium]|uniref:hypothetical protein n=1 Tax=unclassified Bradyrhizobium TaxID=2631580 RepID=UPI002915DD8E|nr:MULTISPECIES: hypothetical protein [unclassified Bradyrhizobium]
MTDREQLIEEIRKQLKALKEGVGSPDSLAMAHKLAKSYSFPVQEIRAIVRKEAEAAGVQLVD